MAPVKSQGPASTTSHDGGSPSADDDDRSKDQQGGSDAKRRKTGGVPAGSGTSGRGVANLTPEQLAKKRANDREAQRAIRERTRNQIETLERRIRELTEQQPYQELQAVLRQKEAIEAENTEIRRRLAQALAIIQPLLDAGAVGGPTSGSGATGPLDVGGIRAGGSGANLAAKDMAPYEDSIPQIPRPHSSAIAATLIGGAPGNVRDGSRSESYSPSIPARQYSAQWQAQHPVPGPHSLQAVMAETNGTGPPGGLSPAQRERLSLLRTTSPERHALGLLSSRTAEQAAAAGPALAGDVHGPTSSVSDAGSAHQHPPYGRPPHDNLLGAVLNYSHLEPPAGPHLPSPHSSSMHSTPDAGSGPATQSSPSQQQGTQPWNTLPAHTGPSCPLDSVLLDFMAERRRLAAAGAPERELIGPHYPDFDFFMLPAEERKGRRAHHPVSQLLTDVLQTFPDIYDPPEKAATFYGMFLTLRWHLCPTQAHYDRLPAWLRPTSWQILTPHPVWIDHLPWPEMREELVRNFSRYPFDEFFVPFTKTMSINWEYGEARIFRGDAEVGGRMESGEDELEMSALFEEHMRDLRNWSIGPSFSHAHPLLVTGSVRVAGRT